MDEIEIHIERTSGTAQPRRSAPRSANPKILIGVVALAVIGLVVWLGSTTPNQAAPIDPTTTTEPFPSSTSTTDIAAPAPNPPPDPSPRPEVEFDEWAAEINADPPAQLAVLDRSLGIFVRGEDGAGQIIQISASTVGTRALDCGGQPVLERPQDFGDFLMLQTARSTCLIQKANLNETQVIEGAPPNADFIAADDDSGWFCKWDVPIKQLAKFVVGEPVGELRDTLACPLLARNDEVLLAFGRLGGLAAELQGPVLVWDRPASDLPVSPVAASVECEFAGIALPFLLCRAGTSLMVVNVLDEDVPGPTPIELQSASSLTYALTSPNGQFALLNRRGPDDGADPTIGARSPGVLYDLESNEVTELPWDKNDYSQLSWVSDTEIAILQWDGPDCESCGLGIELLDITDFSRSYLLSLPENLRISDVQFVD